MRIVVGLGNPGGRYARTRHNAGFMVVERLAARWGIPLNRESAGLLVIGRGTVEDVPTMLVQPQQYMNLSGEALTHLRAQWCAADLIVAHDDIDLAMGRLRVRHDGGFGGHLGLASLGSVCGSNFDRVRVGVGRPPQGVDPAEYVLAELDEVEFRMLNESADRASLAVGCLLTSGLVEAMSRFNRRCSEADQELHRGERPEKS
jgi:peptidyl-tRNA hydrolase, PTH1 family